MPAAEYPSPEEIVVYQKDPATKIATITLSRPERLNAPTSAARLRYAELLHRANIDDDVKVLVIRGLGQDFGSGVDLPEFMEALQRRGRRAPAGRVPPHGGRRRAAAAGRLVPRRRAAHPVVRQPARRLPEPAGVQEDQHRRGQGLLLRVALLPGRGRRPGDLFRRCAVRPRLVPLPGLGPPHVDLGADDGPAQVPGDGLHRASLHRGRDVRLQLPQQGRTARPA